MIITLKILTCTDGDAAIAGLPPRELVVVRGYLPSGQEAITSRVVERAETVSALRSVIEWIFAHRPSWGFAIDDRRTGHTEVAS